MLENIRLAFQGIWSHKMRSFLTMLGIIIGIASIIAIVSTIKGTSEQIKEDLIGAGSNTVNIYLYDGADGTGNILEQWTNQSISLFGEEGLSISKSGMLASSGSLKIDWLGADGQQLGSSKIVSPISFKAE